MWSLVLLISWAALVGFVTTCGGAMSAAETIGGMPLACLVLLVYFVIMIIAVPHAVFPVQEIIWAYKNAKAARAIKMSLASS